MTLAFAFGGCGKEAELTEEEIAEAAVDPGEEVSIDDEEIFSDDLMPLDEEELEELENPDYEDDQFYVADESENMEDDEYEVEGEDSDTEEMDLSEGYSAIEVKEDGEYTSKMEVAAYLYQFGHLPSNYITKKEAQELGWSSSKDLDEIASGKSIGGDEYANADKMLPEEEGRTYYECDVNYTGGTRGKERLVYSDDGLIFYTSDNYDTFEQIY